MKIFGTINLDTLSPFKTICPSCKKEVKLSHLEFSDRDDEVRQKLDSNNWKEIPRYLQKTQYEMFTSKVKPHIDKKFIATIARIEDHKIGLFKQKCELSDKLFKVYHHVLFNHENKTAGATSFLGEEISRNSPE